MKQKQSVTKRPNHVRDHGKDLLDTIIFLVLLLGVLWYLNI